MRNVYEELKARICPRFLTEEKYRKGHIAILNALSETIILGVHIPDIKALAKDIQKRGEADEVLNDLEQRAKGALRHDAADVMCVEEKLLWGILAGSLKDVSQRIERMRAFVPYIANWAECDTFCSGAKFKAKDRDLLWNFIAPYYGSRREFEVRFGVIMGMCNFLDDEYLSPVFQSIKQICYEDIHTEYTSMKVQPYYVKMGVAWCLATALAKYPEQTREFVNFERGKALPEDVVKLYVRKARESFRTKNVSAL